MTSVDGGDAASVTSQPARPLRRILCAADFTSASVHALRHAIAIARRCGAEVHVVHAVGGRAIPQLEARLRSLVAEHASPEVAVSSRVVAGSPPQVIAAQAEALDSDVIVIGAHARTGFARMLNGSVGDQVIRIAPVPVLTVPEGDRRPVPEALRSMVCAVDFSPASIEALEHAVRLARLLGAVVHVVHVWQLPTERASRSFGDGTRGADLSRDLEALVQPYDAYGVTITRQLRCGEPAEEIVELAVELETERIVMATAGRRGIEHFVLGSVAEQVIRTSSVPVWTVRAAVR